MKKRDLLLAGLVLVNVSAFAQPGVDEPIRYSDDARVIFVQDFEDAPKTFNKIRLNPDPKRPTTLYTWNVEPVDSITKVNYYTVGAGSISNLSDMQGSDFTIAGTRDTLMYLYDGVLRTDAAWPDDSCLSFDNQFIVTHDDMSQKGEGLGGKAFGLDRWGENGGTQYFRYYSATSLGVGSRTESEGDYYVPEYRRNLFIRNIPIEEHSSYRVTVFVKPTLSAQGELKSSIKPRLGLDLMRGYFHSEKSFMVNPLKKEAKNSWNQDVYATFDDKTNYTTLDEGKWNKITLMAYYNNDEIGNASAYMLSYYWDSDWNWDVKVDADGKVAGEGTAKTLKYIQQPDKYFVRLSFRSDSTIFDVDNLSLTKSWIGGVEYTGTMARVDFGYETNLGALAQAAKEANNIASVELPGRYFDVWGLYNDEWESIPIQSAEYQGDGFMYMWTQPWEDNGDPRYFDDYDSVLVSFFNPTDSAELMLKYTGAQYPNGADSAWNADKENRIVYDFHNEIGYLNPTITTSPVTGEVVTSLADKAPVLQKLEYEDGSFGLNPDTREITFKFSKNLSFDNLGIDAKRSQIIVINSDNEEEYWNIKPYEEGAPNTGWTTIVRPDEYTAPLSGDYEFLFHKVTHLSKPTLEAHYTPDFSLNYHFGNFAQDARVIVIAKSDWRSEIVETGAWDRPMPASLWCYDKEDGFFGGEGKNYSPYKKCGLYKMKDDGKNGDALFYLSGRQNGNNGSLYTVESLEAGNYNISFSSFGWARQNDIKVYLYSKPAEMEYESLSGATKTQIGTYKPAYQTSWSGNNTEESWNEKVEKISFDFEVPANGTYVIEWETPKEGSQSYYGVAIGNYTISAVATGLSFGPVSSLNAVLDAAQATLDAASDAKYKGADYNNFKSVKEEGDAFIASKAAIYNNQPKEYEDEVKLISAASATFKAHMDTVDAFFQAYDDAQALLLVYADSLVAYQGFAVVGALSDLVGELNEYNCSTKAPGVIAADTKRLTDAIKAVNARQALIDKFNATIADAEGMRDASDAYAASTEYEDLVEVIGTANSTNAVEATDELINDVISGLVEGMKGVYLLNYYDELKPSLAGVATKRIVLLDSLATALGVQFDADMQQRIANVATDDDVLAGEMKALIKEALYNCVAKGIKDTIDLTGFIKNYYLYATPRIVERTDKRMPANNSDLGPDPTIGAQIQHVAHEYNNSSAANALGGKQPIWVMIIGQEFNDLYPGWTVTAKAAGNHMVTLEGEDAKYQKLEAGVKVFDAELAMDWNCRAELKSLVEDLPIGTYTLGVNLSKNTSASNTTLEAVVGADSFKKTSTGTGLFTVDGINVSSEGAMSIILNLASGNGWSEADDFSLTFTPLAGFDYNTVATVVDFAQIEASGEYEYYTLNWIKVEYPEKNQVYFRKSGNVVEKVIFK